MLEPAFAQWQELSVQWLHKTFGKPVFTEKNTGRMMQINEVTADGSQAMLEPAFAQWQELSVQWLHKTFGKPVFTEKNTGRMMQILKEQGYVK